MWQASALAVFLTRRVDMPTTKIAFAILALGALVACETVEGAGRDMSNAGRAITSESQQVQEDL
jgi:predicted small secreted protein